jgi:hypothetical protein
MRNIFQSRRGPQASLNRSERFLHLSGDDEAITMCPIAQTIVIIHCSLVFHATFLHYTSGSGIVSFTFCVDALRSQHRKGIGKGLCWLLGTSVPRKRRVFRTDVPSSQHNLL